MLAEQRAEVYSPGVFWLHIFGFRFNLRFETGSILIKRAAVLEKLKLRVPGDVVFRALGDEAVMLNLASGVYFGLNSVGTRIWQLISEHGSTEKAIEALLAEYEVDEGRLRRDVDDLIRQLSEKGLVKTDAEEPSPPE